MPPVQGKFFFSFAFSFLVANKTGAKLQKMHRSDGASWKKVWFKMEKTAFAKGM
jgi:hypothetical protein